MPALAGCAADEDRTFPADSEAIEPFCRAAQGSGRVPGTPEAAFAEADRAIEAMQASAPDDIQDELAVLEDALAAVRGMTIEDVLATDPEQWEELNDQLLEAMTDVEAYVSLNCPDAGGA